MKKNTNYSNLPFDFTLKINDKFICQRYFNVENLNKLNLNPINVEKIIDNIMGCNNGNAGMLGVIPSFLKENCKKYLWSKYKPYDEDDRFEKRKENQVDSFRFEFRHKGKLLKEGYYECNWYPTAVRYEVNNGFKSNFNYNSTPDDSMFQINIREIIPTIIEEISSYLSYDYSNN